MKQVSFTICQFALIELIKEQLLTFRIGIRAGKD